ncbi:bacterio-opsin activator domain-containing protein [Halorarius litoreus]|uniref:bacterio-opsin activator domain-containing protein n=1 Tax=Halorarius litoreus TaxID=2962676 RepID=UPI0020CD14E2|nr:bacterio-opsin activator domain-containing protein [Halorarius litoreus]
MTDDDPVDPVSPAAQYRALAEVANDVIVTIDTDSTIRFVNDAVEDVLGYTAADLHGRSLTVLMDDAMATEHETGFERYLRTGERRVDWDYVELVGRHRDGSAVPLGVSFAEFTDDGERLFTGIVRDISDRKAWERRLEALSELSHALADRTTVEAVCERVHETTTQLFDGETAIALYDEHRGSLRPERVSPGFDREGAPLAGLTDPAWEAFADGAPQTVESPPAPFEWVHVEPLGKHGVLLTATETGEGPPVEPGGTELAAVLADRATTALDRLARERTLQQHNSLLEERNEALAHVNQLNDIIRSLTTALVDAASRADIESAVVETLAEAEPFEFVWFGAPDPVGGVLEPKASGGWDQGFLEDRTVPVDPDGDAALCPTGRAAATRDLCVENDLHTDPPYAPWRRRALECGFRAVAAVPIEYDDVRYGVLTIYAGESGVFDRMEQSVLGELGGMIGYAINAVERRNALVDEGAIELEYRVTDADLAVIQFVRETGARFEFENVMADPDRGLRVFFTVHGATPETTREFAAAAPTVEDLRLVTEVGEDASLYEAWIRDDGPIGTLVGMNAVPRAFTASGDEAWFTVELPRSVDVRQFTTTLDRAYDDLELAARRERDRPVQTEQEFYARLEEHLTDRQFRVLEAAYWNGYFAWPRASTGGEIAETLDISQPTFSRHLRGAEQNLFDLLFDEADG